LSGLKDWPKEPEANNEQSLFFIKPDAVEDGLVGMIFGRLARDLPDIEIVDEMTFVNPDRELIEEHYAEHKGKFFCDWLVDSIVRGPIIVCIVEGDNAIARLREWAGVTDPSKAAIGTIRGDFANGESVELSTKQKRGTRTRVHSSENAAAAKREIRLWMAAMKAVRNFRLKN